MSVSWYLYLSRGFIHKYSISILKGYFRIVWVFYVMLYGILILGICTPSLEKKTVRHRFCMIYGLPCTTARFSLQWNGILFCPHLKICDFHQTTAGSSQWCGSTDSCGCCFKFDNKVTIILLLCKQPCSDWIRLPCSYWQVVRPITSYSSKGACPVLRV